MAASTGGAEDVADMCTPSELSKLPSDQAVGSFASVCSPNTTLNETICKGETIVCNARSAAETSPSLGQEAQLMDHELLHCSDVAPNPGIPAQLESKSTIGATGTSFPPMVDSVTNDMLKVSINYAPSSIEDHMHLAIGGSGHTEGHETSLLFPVNANDGLEGNVSGNKAGAEPKLLSSNGHAVKADAPRLQMNNCIVEVSNGMPGSLSKDASELGSSIDAHAYANADADASEDDDDEEEADDDDNDEEANDSISEVEQDSDSSSSTSSLSFLGSSSDDDNDDEIDSLNHLLNGTNNSKDLVMEEESECEEGELKESPSQRKKKGGLKKKIVNENSEDEEGLKESARSRKKEKDLPYVPKVSVTLKEYHKTVPVGFVSSVVGVNLIVEGLDGQQALTEGSILWLTDKRLPLGVIDELFGPVKKPFYVVRYNDDTEIPEEAKEGAQVSYVQDFAGFVLKNPDLFLKGYDDSGNEDDSDSEVNFSDDEKEAEYKRSKSRTKRTNSESSTLEVDNRQHQERRAEGKRMNRDNKIRRSRGENARAFQSNQEFGRRPPRHQNARFQRHRSEREPDMEVPTQTFNERNRNWHGNQSPVRQAKSQQSVGVSQLKPSTPVKSTSDSSVASLSQMQLPNLNPSQSTSSPSVLEPVTTTNQSCTSQPNQMNQFLHNTLVQAQPQSLPQPVSQQVQLQHSNHPCNLKPLPPQQIQLNESNGLNQRTLPQVVPWQSRQSQMCPSQSPSIQHSQMPVYGHAVVAGHVPQVAIGGCGISLPNKPPLQPGADMVQGLPSAYQSPIYQQQAPTLNQPSSSMPHLFSGQGSQVPPNVGMPMGTQIPAVPANCFSVGVQPTALAAPVLGIPVGQASIPFNYPMQMVSNQNFSGFSPAFANPNLPATYGVPDQARTMQSMATASWQHPPQNSSAPPPRWPIHQMRGSHPGRRF